MLDRNLPSRRDKTALYSDARTLSFGEAATEANRVGNALRRLGVGMGDTVALLSLDGAESVSVFFGTLKIGAISVGINTLLTEKEYAYILDDFRARVLVVHESLWPRIASILDVATFVKHVVVIGGLNERSVAYRDWIDGNPDVLEGDLITFCREQLAEYKRPRKVEFLDELPKTANGKIQRYKLRKGQEMTRP